MKSAFVTIIGCPSAGKSTLMNALCGEKVAITSPVPQTTRNAIRGIMNTSLGQVVFQDTPGYHISEKKLNIYLKDVVHRTISDADAILYVIDSSRAPGREENAVMELLDKSRIPVIVAVNKIDSDTPLLQEIRGWILSNITPSAMINISALKKTNLPALIDAIMLNCPEGEPHYPLDFYTDQNPEFRITEIIREKTIHRCEQELPHAIYVEIADMEWANSGIDRDKNPESEKLDSSKEASKDENLTGQRGSQQERKKLWVRAFIHVERPSQVAILVGHKGSGIKAIRIAALREMQRIFPWKIRLDLRVKVHEKWRKKDVLLKRMMNLG